MYLRQRKPHFCPPASRFAAIISPTEHTSKLYSRVGTIPILCRLKKKSIRRKFLDHSVFCSQRTLELTLRRVQYTNLPSWTRGRVAHTLISEFTEQVFTASSQEHVVLRRALNYNANRTINKLHYHGIVRNDEEVWNRLRYERGGGGDHRHLHFLVSDNNFYKEIGNSSNGNSSMKKKIIPLRLITVINPLSRDCRNRSAVLSERASARRRSIEISDCVNLFNLQSVLKRAELAFADDRRTPAVPVGPPPGLPRRRAAPERLTHSEIRFIALTLDFIRISTNDESYKIKC
ncbi:hypothetical protein EVAR_86190_1 [Eumeta japonica]|uniref:Uncharacterized protein n=1 Tax=Eumeta variegata TaxID=151549 RepID=A0A4C1UBJ0_EUMVA|nr:hypothetical protein EVAR_86190_1 [Eumeta japonica]